MGLMSTVRVCVGLLGTGQETSGGGCYSGTGKTGRREAGLFVGTEILDDPE